MAIGQIPPASGGSGINVSGQGLKYEVIQSISMGSGTPTLISFTDIPSKYRALKLTIFAATLSSSQSWRIRLNSSGTVTNYSFATRGLATTTWSTTLDTNTTHFQITSGTDNRLSGEFNIMDTNIAGFKTASWLNSDSTRSHEGWGIYGSTDVISSLYILNSGGVTFTAGTAILLGSE